MSAGYVLLAQIDRQLAARVSRALEAEGMSAVVSRDGAKAAELMGERGLPDILITDLSLAGEDGFALLRELRSRAPAERVPAIIFSPFAHLREAALQRRHELGFAAALPASAPWETLRRSIERARALARPETHPVAVDDEEAARSAREEHLARLGLGAGSPASPGLQTIAAETAQGLGVPTCFISVVSGGHAHLKAAVNLPAGVGAIGAGTARWTFCQQVAEAAHPLVISDAPAHPAFSAEPVVREGLVGSYLGVPILSSEGVVIGALGVLAPRARTFTAADVDELTVSARRAAAELELPAAPAVSGMPTEAYFRAALAHLPVGVLFVGPSHKLAFANSRAAELLGVPLAELGHITRAEVVARLSQRGASPADLEALLRIPAVGPYVESAELELVRPERLVLRWSCRPVSLGDETAQMVLIADMTRERLLLEDRERLARTDPLTGLGNRRNAEEAIAREVQRARRQGEPLSFILFDIDHFKRVNDEHGHATGDQVLRALGEIFRTAFRGFDLTSRWGGEEFLAVLPGADLHRARQVADRVRTQIGHAAISGVGAITVSAGVAELASDESADEAIGRADEKLYEAKSAGRDRIA